MCAFFFQHDPAEPLNHLVWWHDSHSAKGPEFVRGQPVLRIGSLAPVEHRPMASPCSPELCELSDHIPKREREAESEERNKAMENNRREFFLVSPTNQAV